MYVHIMTPHAVSNVLTLNKVTLSVTPLAVLTRECWRESCTGDISGSEGRLLVMISLGVPVPAPFIAMTWKT